MGGPVRSDGNCILGLPTQNSYIDAAHGILQFIMPTLQVAPFAVASLVDKTKAPGQKTRGTRGALSSGEVSKI